jgi:hypothetical protein
VTTRPDTSATCVAPDERFQPEALRPLPLLTADYRDCTEALVHKDLRLTFDGNRYCVPPRYVGHKLTVKADSSSVTIYDQTHEIVCCARCWERGQTFGAERFQKELYAQMAAASAPPHSSGSCGCSDLSPSRISENSPAPIAPWLVRFAPAASTQREVR